MAARRRPRASRSGVAGQVSGSSPTSPCRVSSSLAVDGVAPLYEGFYQEGDRDRSERDVASRDDGAASAGDGLADPAEVKGE